MSDNVVEAGLRIEADRLRGTVDRLRALLDRTTVERDGLLAAVIQPTGLGDFRSAVTGLCCPSREAAEKATLEAVRATQGSEKA